MLDSIPVPFQAIVWPLAGAVLILALGRLLPNWARRLLAMGAALASLAVLWSLRSGTVESVQAVAIVWAPLQFFRLSPALHADGLSLLCGMLLSSVTAAMVLGIRGQEAQKTAWHGWLLVALAGSLVAIMAANLLALALGSALLDLAFVAIIVSAAARNDGPMGSPRPGLSLAIPGFASTLLLLVSALQMDVQVGHASLLSRNLAEGALVLVGAAGMLRAFLFPLHPRGLSTPEHAAALLLPVGVGGYLLARVQALAPVLSRQPWTMALAVIALLAGGLLAWSQSAGLRGGEPRLPSSNAGFGFWPGTLVYQTAYTLAFVLLLTAGTPWPLVGLILCLAALVVWWAGSLEAEELPHSRGSEWIARQVRPRWAVVQSYLAKQFSRLLRRKGTDHPGFPFSRYGKILLPSIALASLAGMPFTVGARGRWPYYAAWLKRGDPAVLVALAADVFFCAGLWTAFTMVLQPVGEHRPRPAPALATFVLVLGVVILGIAPGIVSDGLAAGGPQSASSGEPGYPSGGVSVWGLGFLYVLPWLLGAWLARMRRRLRDVPERLQTVVGLDWLYHALDWLGQRLLGALHWLSQVGEGEGWWGWALIVLALGVLLLAGA